MSGEFASVPPVWRAVRGLEILHIVTIMTILVSVYSRDIESKHVDGSVPLDAETSKAFEARQRADKGLPLEGAIRVVLIFGLAGRTPC